MDTILIDALIARIKAGKLTIGELKGDVKTAIEVKLNDSAEVQG